MECGGLDQHLCVHTAVHARVDQAVPVVIDDVHCGEPDQGCTAVHVVPVVVGIGDVQMAQVLVFIAVGVADEGTFPLLIVSSLGAERVWVDGRGRGSKCSRR